MRLLGLEVDLHPEVYEPAEDTLLVARHLDAAPGERCLDLGTGTGLLALVMARQGGEVVASDLNPLALRLARANAAANGLALQPVLTDLAAGLAGPFDLVACNPPYLPTAPREHVRGPLDRAFDGGPDGALVTRRLLPRLPELLAPGPGARAYLLASSLQPLEALEDEAGEHGLAWQVVEEERHPGFEALLCVRLSRQAAVSRAR